jgi:transcriptional regulator with XRE-family HTH domain
MRLGKKIEIFRTNKGLSIEQLAELADIPRSTLADYEAADDAKYSNLKKICKVLEVPIEALEDDATIQINNGNENVQNNVSVHVNLNINVSNKDDIPSIVASLENLVKK